MDGNSKDCNALSHEKQHKCISFRRHPPPPHPPSPPTYLTGPRKFGGGGRGTDGKTTLLKYFHQPPPSQIDMSFWGGNQVQTGMAVGWGRVDVFHRGALLWGRHVELIKLNLRPHNNAKGGDYFKKFTRGCPIAVSSASRGRNCDIEPRRT